MEVVVVVLLVVVAVLCAVALAGIYFSRVVIKPKTFSRSYSKDFVLERGEFDRRELDTLPRKEVSIESPFGYRLSGYFFPNGSSKRIVVFCHGITWNIFGSIKYMLLMRKLGFAGLVYDHRNHGDSGGTSTTFGKYEKLDLQACVEWLRDRFGPDCVIGLHGESLGAAVALQYLEMDPEVAFCIADCAFSDLIELLKLRIKEDYKLPSFPLISIADFFTFLASGMHFRDASPARSLIGVETPILFVHGDEDVYIPPQMSKDMHSQNPERRKLFLSPGAGHAESFLKNPEEYQATVTKFLESIGLLQGY